MQKKAHLEINPTEIIQKARQTKATVALTLAEFDYVMTHPELNEVSRLILIIIAFKSASSANLSCTLSDLELIHMSKQEMIIVQRSISTLKRLQLIDFKRDEASQTAHYTFTLPHDGLLVLLKAPPKAIPPVERVQTFNHLCPYCKQKAASHSSEKNTYYPEKEKKKSFLSHLAEAFRFICKRMSGNSYSKYT